MALTPSTTHCGHPGSRGAPVPTSTTLRREAGPKVGAMLERRAENFEGPYAGKYHCSSDENHDAQQTQVVQEKSVEEELPRCSADRVTAIYRCARRRRWPFVEGHNVDRGRGRIDHHLRNRSRISARA